MMKHDALITLSTDHGELEDVPALFDYDIERIHRDPSVGIFSGYTEVTTCELVSVRIGGLTLSNYQLRELVGMGEIARIEEATAEAIMEQIATGDLIAAE